MAPRTDLLPGTLDMLVMKALSHGPNHGYGVANRIRPISNEALHVEEGSLYPALHRLEKRGYLTSDWRRSDSNRRAKYYHLTPKGRRQLKSAEASWNQLSAAIGKVMNARAAVLTGA